MNRRLAIIWASAAATSMVLTTALALIIGGGAPIAPPAGLPDPGRLAAWTAALLPVATRITATVTVGFGLVAAGAVGQPANDVHDAACTAAWWWAMLMAAQIAIFRWNLDGQVGWLDTTRGRAFLIELVLIVSAYVCLRSTHRAAIAAGCFASVLGLLPSLYAGHALSADHRIIAGISISVHVIAATIWIGGLVAVAWLALRRSDPWTTALPV